MSENKLTQERLERFREIIPTNFDNLLECEEISEENIGIGLITYLWELFIENGKFDKFVDLLAYDSKMRRTGFIAD